MLHSPARWTAPLGAVVFVVLWIVGEAGRGPWPDLLWFIVPSAVMIGAAPFVPFLSLALIMLVPALQLFGVVVHPAANTWPIYLAMPVTAFLLGAVAERSARRFTLVAGFAAVLQVAYLMAVPGGGQHGWASWTGEWRRYSENPHEQDFIAIVLIGVGGYFGAWSIGILIRLGASGRLSRIAALLGADVPGPSIRSVIAGLSPRELEIFDLIARGLSNAEIAAHEHISEATVKSHVSSILRKLDLRSRTQLAAHAYSKGLLFD